MQDDTPWNAPQDAPAPSDSEALAQPLDFDLACVRCGYNLRGVLPTGACPECGEPVDTTLRPDLLHQADPGWLDSLRKGSNWTVVAIIMSLAMIPVGMAIGFASVATAPNPASGTLPTGALILLSVLGLIVAVTYGVGVWFLTDPEPERITDLTSRSLARWLILPGMILGLFSEFFNAAGTKNAALAAAAIDTISSIMVLVGSLAGLIYLRSLAHRIPEPSLAKQSTTVFWGYLATMSVLILFGFGAAIYAFAAATGTTNPNAAAGAAAAGIGLLMCPIGLAFLVFLIWWIVLMFRYRTRFTQAHAIATSRQQTVPSNSV